MLVLHVCKIRLTELELIRKSIIELTHVAKIIMCFKNMKQKK